MSASTAATSELFCRMSASSIGAVVTAWFSAMCAVRARSTSALQSALCDSAIACENRV